MKNIAPVIKTFFAFFLLWLLLNFNLEPITIIFGVLVSSLVTFLAFGILYDENGFVFRGIKIHFLVIYVVFLIPKIFKSAFIFIINMFKRNYVPIVLRIDLNVEDPIKVAIIANSITLTPGTITIDIEKNTIVVMVLAKEGTDHEVLEMQIRERYEKLLLGRRTKS